METDRSNSQYREGRTMWDPAEWENGPKGPLPPGGLLGLPRPFCDPFRRMLDCPALVSRLNMLMGASNVFESQSCMVSKVRIRYVNRPYMFDSYGAYSSCVLYSTMVLKRTLTQSSHTYGDWIGQTLAKEETLHGPAARPVSWQVESSMRATICM